MNAVQLIKKDHRAVEELFKSFEKSSDAKQKYRLVQQIIMELSVHAIIEEELLYPAARRVLPEGEELIPKALEDHHLVKWTLEELIGLKPGAERFEAKVKVLIEGVRKHVAEEERVLLPHLERALDDKTLNELGDALVMAKRVAPTRPHPRAPDTPPGNILAGSLAAVVDRSRDVLMSLTNQSGRRELRQAVARTAKQVRSPAGRRILGEKAAKTYRQVGELGRKGLRGGLETGARMMAPESGRRELRAQAPRQVKQAKPKRPQRSQAARKAQARRAAKKSSMSRSKRR